MNKKLEITTLVIAILALVLSIASLITPAKSANDAETVQAANGAETEESAESAETAEDAAETGSEDIQYVMYLGTNDKDTNEPVCEPEEAQEKARNILIKRLGGYTIQEAAGGWLDDEGRECREYTMVIYISDSTLDQVHETADDLIAAFNQSSVLIQANKTTTEFYAGE